MNSHLAKSPFPPRVNCPLVNSPWSNFPPVNSPLSDSPCFHFGITRTLRRNIRKARKNFDTPPNPATREEIPELPEQYQLTVNGEQFMIFDSGIGDHERMYTTFGYKKRIQHLGLQQRYNDDQEFSLHVRMLCALAFLPPDDVVQGFEDFTDHIRINYQGEVDNLLEYFEDTYIGRHRRNAPRRTAMFPVVLWNMFHRTDEELPRTNNSVEGWHRSFQAHVSSSHPIF